jgi:23S rRNA (cytidine2498-2'-O)-methyltransferase
LKLPATKKFTDLVNHVRDNGLRYVPAKPVDWLVCDMIVAPHETLRVLKYWLEKGLMENFVINLKLAKAEPWLAIEEALAVLKNSGFAVTMARHLFHDRWEITLMGAKNLKTKAPAKGS